MGTSLLPVRLSCKQTHTRIAQFQKKGGFTKWFHFSERTTLVRDWRFQSLLSACHFGKEEISYGGLLRYGISILLLLAIANLPPCISIP